MEPDPRERIETENVRCGGNANGWHFNHHGRAGRVDWPEVVSFAEAILAADAEWREQNAPVPERRFPVIASYSRDSPARPKSIPWSWIAPHEPQALKNHCRQSLETLASRGGLSPVEIYAVLNDLPLFSGGELQIGEVEAAEWLAAKLAAKLAEGGTDGE